MDSFRCESEASEYIDYILSEKSAKEDKLEDEVTLWHRKDAPNKIQEKGEESSSSNDKRSSPDMPIQGQWKKYALSY